MKEISFFTARRRTYSLYFLLACAFILNIAPVITYAEKPEYIGLLVFSLASLITIPVLMLAILFSVLHYLKQDRITFSPVGIQAKLSFVYEGKIAWDDIESVSVYQSILGYPFFWLIELRLKPQAKERHSSERAYLSTFNSLLLMFNSEGIKRSKLQEAIEQFFPGVVDSDDSTLFSFHRGTRQLGPYLFRVTLFIAIWALWAFVLFNILL